MTEKYTLRMRGDAPDKIQTAMEVFLDASCYNLATKRRRDRISAGDDPPDNARPGEARGPTKVGQASFLMRRYRRSSAREGALDAGGSG
jgi:hypothetical protein